MPNTKLRIWCRLQHHPSWLSSCWLKDLHVALLWGAVWRGKHSFNTVSWMEVFFFSFIQKQRLPPTQPLCMTGEQPLTHHQQMSSFAFGHLQLWTPDEIYYSLLGSGHGKPNAAIHTPCCTTRTKRDCEFSLQNSSLQKTRAVKKVLTCQGWRWRSWSCWPSWPVWSPVRSHGCSAAQRRPEGGTVGIKLAAFLVHT